MSEQSIHRDTIIIEPRRSTRNYWRDLWRYRELFYVLSWRDLKVRYKQTVIGVLWALIRPALTLLIFSVVFGRIAGLPSQSDMPYALMVLAGLLPWQLFANAVRESSESLIQNPTLITKVYFPKVIIPISTLVTSLVDFIISFLLLAPIMLFYDYLPSWRLLLIPFFLIPLVALAVGMGLCLSALNIRFRDFRYVIPFLLQLGLYISPVGFSAQVLPKHWEVWYAFNPIVGIIEAFRWAFSTGNTLFPSFSFGLASLLSLMLLVSGWTYFRKQERFFADVV